MVQLGMISIKQTTMKKATLIAAILLSLSAKSQDSLVVKMDTTTFKNIIAIIQKQLDSKAASNYILEALSKYELVMDKPKEKIKK
jgi:hypothetical protein